MSSSEYLYNQLADSFRKKIITGEIKPGEKLPSVRTLAEVWSCTIGTVQKAYQVLSDQGLVSSRAGQGTLVTYGIAPNQYLPYRRAHLVHRSETFILEALGLGYGPEEIEEAVREVLDRMRVIKNEPAQIEKSTIRFNGSHDPFLAWISAHFGQISPKSRLELSFTGSLHGLIALENNETDIAGCHLWDEKTDSYNLPFIQKILPGRALTLVNLATRTIGLIIPPGNPFSLKSLQDLLKEGIQFVNRQDGSGIRVWLDAQLRNLKIPHEQIHGFEHEVNTHSEVALEIAEKRANAGIGLQIAAEQYGLEFIPLTNENYDLVFSQSVLSKPPIQKLLGWLISPDSRAEINNFPGYHSDHTGQSITIL